MAELSAVDVMGALRRHWSTEQGAHTHLVEVGQSSDRQGRRIDLLVINNWRSRGLSVDAVEIKVSVSDLRRELDDPTKADFWWRHSDRFWLATTTKVYAKAPPIPTSWGVLLCSGRGVTVEQRPPKRDREPWPWPLVVGALRCAVDAGPGVLAAARSAGYDEGVKATKKHEAALDRADELTKLRSAVALFEERSGVRIDTYNGGEIGKAVRMVRQAQSAPYRLTQTAEALRKSADLIDEIPGLLGGQP